MSLAIKNYLLYSKYQLSECSKRTSGGVKTLSTRIYERVQKIQQNTLYNVRVKVVLSESWLERR